MKNNAGLIAAVTVMVAFFGISNLPKGSSGGAAPDARTAAKAAESRKKNRVQGANRSIACEEIGQRLKVFLVPPQNASNPYDNQNTESCPPQGTASLSFSAGVRFVIAMAPDPVATHLPLQFDRAIEIIQQAAEDEKYSYDSSWFPWNETPKDYPLFSDQREAEDEQENEQEQPGVIVFRRALSGDLKEVPYQSGLVVFVVAETPTGGIDRKEFQNAITWIHELGALVPERKLNILGPTFSGSLPSLDLALQSDTLLPAGGSPIPVSVSSGSVSSESSYTWFRNGIEKNHAGTFETAMGGDALMMDRFFRYLTAQKYSLGCVAVISEDETAFGASSKTSVKGNETPASADKHCYDRYDPESTPIYLYYPRDIATLRSAYEQQSIFNSRKVQSDESAVTTTLRGDLTEPASGDHDTVRSYGGQLTPLAQEAVLLGITNILKEKQIQFVVLRSTNSLDEIFLSQFLRRAYPEARIVIDGADLLFQRGAEGSSLRGVMVLSSYPLLAWQQDWTMSIRYANNGSYRIFGEDLAEGLYIAARGLFRENEVCGDKPCARATGTEIPINNYAAPEWARPANDNSDEQRPGTWLSVVGHHQFWPMAFLSSYSDEHPKKDEILPTTAQRNDAPQPASTAAQRPLRFTIELVVLLVLCLLWSSLHFAWCCSGSIAPFPSLFRLAYFAPVPKMQHAGLIAFGSLLPAMTAIIIAAACGLFYFEVKRASALAAWTLCILLVSFFACRQNYKLHTSVGSPAYNFAPAAWRRMATLCTGAAFVFLVGLHVFLVSGLGRENAVPAFWRASHLLSGVSPLMPQVLLLVGMYVWFWFCLRGLALFGDDRPLLPKGECLPTLQVPNRVPVMQMFSREQVAEPVEDQALPAGKRYLQTLIVTLLATFAIFSLVLEGFTLRTLGERRYGIMMFGWLCICIAMILADIVQFWATWRKLRPLLIYLDRLPLRRTLASLRGLSWSSVWAMGGNALEERYCLISRQFESLTHLRSRIIASTELSVEKKVTSLETIKECREKGLDFGIWYSKLKDTFVEDLGPLQNFQEELAATAGAVLKDLLRPAWQLETDSLIFKRSASGGDDKTMYPGGDDGDEKKDDSGLPSASAAVPAYVLAAEEFFVLPYLGFIQNTLGRLRTIVLGSLFLFVATTFCVSSYPFDPLPVLGGMFLTVFVIAAGTVALVFAQMHRDSTLSHITNTEPGELGGQYWLHLLTFGVGPLLGLLTTLFPSITDFVSSWLQPSMQSLK